MAYESTAPFRDEELANPYPEPIDTNWDDPYKTKRERLADQAGGGSLDQNPTSGYGLNYKRNHIPYQKSEEQKTYDNKRKYSRGWCRKGTYIVLPRESTTK